MEETSVQMLARLGDNAREWAKEFNRMAVRLGYSEMDEGWLTTWFANVIEHSCDVRRVGHNRIRLGILCKRLHIPDHIIDSIYTSDLTSWLDKRKII